MKFKNVYNTILEKKRYNPLAPVEVLQKYKHDPAAFISFTHNEFGEKSKGEKLGINPKTAYDTPIGIYAYPIKAMWYDIRDNKIPFAGDNPNIFVFEPKNPDRVAYDSEYDDMDLRRDYNKLVEMMIPIYKNLRSINTPYTPSPHDIFSASYIELYNGAYVNIHQEKEIQKKLEKALEDPVLFKAMLIKQFQLYEDEIEPEYKTTQLQKFWSLTRQIAQFLVTVPKYKGIKSTTMWTSIMFKFYDGIVDDRGYGIIHSNEPTQAVFFNASVINVLDLIKRHVSSQQQSFDLRYANKEISEIREFVDLQNDILDLSKKGESKKFTELFPKFINYFDKYHSSHPNVQQAAAMKGDVGFGKRLMLMRKKMQDFVKHEPFQDMFLKNMHNLSLHDINSFMKFIGSSFAIAAHERLVEDARDNDRTAFSKYRGAIANLAARVFGSKELGNLDNARSFVENVFRTFYNDTAIRHKSNIKRNNKYFKNLLNEHDELSLGVLKGLLKSGHMGNLPQILRLLQRSYKFVNSMDKHEDYPEMLMTESRRYESKHFLREFFKLLVYYKPQVLENGGIAPEYNEDAHLFEVVNDVLNDYMNDSFLNVYSKGKQIKNSRKIGDSSDMMKDFDDILFNAVNHYIDKFLKSDKQNMNDIFDAARIYRILLRRLKNEKDGKSYSKFHTQMENIPDNTFDHLHLEEPLRHRLMNVVRKLIENDVAPKDVRSFVLGHPDDKLRLYVERKLEEKRIADEKKLHGSGI